MAEPTYSEGIAKLSAAINVLQKLKLHVAFDTPNTVDLLRTYESTSKASGVPAAQASGAAQAVRSALEAPLANSSAIFNPLLLLIARSAQVASQADGPQAQFDDLYRYMHANTLSVLGRRFTRGAFAAGSPSTGNGQWERVTVDAKGYGLEACWAEVFTHRCVKDANLGEGGKARQRGQEVWRITGLPFAGVAEWGVSGRGSGLDTFLTAVNGDDSLLVNASFAARSGTDGAPTALTGYTVSPAVVGDGSDFTIDRTNYFQESLKESKNPGALRIKASTTLYQLVRDLNVTIDTAFPYYDSIALNPKQFAAIGTFVFTLGGKSTTTYLNGAKLIATVGGAGNVDAGDHDYLFTFVIGGVEYCSVVSSSITAAGGGSTVALTAIAVGPVGTTARKVYRKTIGGTYKLLVTIADNTTTTYSDNTADSGLGATLTATPTTGYLIVKLPDSGGTAADLYPENWNAADAKVQFQWTRLAGDLLADRWMFLPYKPLVSKNQPAGRPMHFMLRVSGSTPDKYLDTGTTTDTETGAVIQDWAHRTWGRSFPSVSSANTVAEPS